MPKKNNRTVSKSGNMWSNKKNSNKRTSSNHKTQKEAIKTAKKSIKQDGGGELTIMGKNGKIRDKITVAPGNDPCPPKDKN